MLHSITCSPMDPLQWMGAVRMRVQTADKTSQVIHTTPVHQLKSCEAKSCLFVRNKSNIEMSGLNQERNLHISSAVYKWKRSKTALNKYSQVHKYWDIDTILTFLALYTTTMDFKWNEQDVL